MYSRYIYIYYFNFIEHLYVFLFYSANKNCTSSIIVELRWKFFLEISRQRSKYRRLIIHVRYNTVEHPVAEDLLSEYSTIRIFYCRNVPLAEQIFRL